MTHLFTSGYEGETIKEFLNKLQAENIDTIVDIRENPYSRKPGFSQKALSNYLKQTGISYYHFQELGTPKPLRNYLAHYQDYRTFFDQYRSYLPEFKDSIDDIIDMGSDKKICLLCFEKDPHYCHRNVVADYIKDYAGKQVEVVHI